MVGGKGEILIKGKKNTHIPKITGTGTKMIGLNLHDGQEIKEIDNQINAYIVQEKMRTTQ